MATKIEQQSIKTEVQYEPGVWEELAPFTQQTTQIEATQTRKVWEFPTERFVIYEPSDEEWCRPLGIGKEVTRTDTLTIPHAIVEFTVSDTS